MAVTEAATITDTVQRPQRVTIYGVDTNGVLRAVQLGTDGQIQLNLTGEGLALDVSVDGVETKLDTLHTDLIAATPAGTNMIGFTSVPVTVSATITRPSDTNAYTANDAWADSTSAPTTGGYTFTSAGRASGKSGVIRSAVITSSADPATLLQGEVWIFDTSVTAVNDNAAFALSDADVLKLVCVIPFTLTSTTAGSGTNSAAIVTDINELFTCVGSANLRYLVKVKNAYTPISGEVLQVRLKIEQLD